MFDIIAINPQGPNNQTEIFGSWEFFESIIHFYPTHLRPG